MAPFTLQQGQGLGYGHGGLVDPDAGQGIKGIADGGNAPCYWDGVATESAWIAAAVKFFVMGQRDERPRFKTSERSLPGCGSRSRDGA